MSDLQDIIATTTVRAYKQGVNDEREHWLKALKEVQFEYDNGVQIAAISDLMETLESGRKAT